MKIEEAILYVLAERNGGLRTESSNHDRMFICFVALILASYIRHIRDSKPELAKTFPSMSAILEEIAADQMPHQWGSGKPFTRRPCFVDKTALNLNLSTNTPVLVDKWPEWPASRSKPNRHTSPKANFKQKVAFPKVNYYIRKKECNYGSKGSPSNIQRKETSSPAGNTFSR